MADVVNLGLIGCGGMMGAHVGSLGQLWEKEIRNFRVTACCDTDLPKAQNLAKQIAAWQGAEPIVYADYREMLDKENDLDAVDLSLIHRDHHSIAIPCIQAGKHITIEKPLGITLRAGKRIMEAAEKQKAVLQVAENYRRDPTERAIKWAIRQGRIGKLRMIYWIDVGERLWHWGWRDDVDAAGGGWSMDGGVHFADLFRFHIGEVEELYAISTAHCPMRYGKPETLEDPIPATTEDTTVAALKFANGVTGQWTSTSAAPGKGISFRTVYGENGSITWGEGLTARKEKLTMEELVKEYMASLSAEESERLFPRGVTDTVATELKEFIDAVQTGSPIEVTGLEGYKDEAISLALYESSLLGEPVRLKDIEDLKVEGYQSRFNEMYGIA